MSADQAINILVTITLIQLMVAIGLGVTFVDIARVARNSGLVALAALANYVLVPAATVGLLWLFHSPPLVAAGFLVAAVCPGAPYGPPFTAMDGQGVAIAPHFLVAGDLRSGRLVKPFRLEVPQPRRWYLVCRKERRGEPRIARFRDWLIAQIEADPAMR